MTIEFIDDEGSKFTLSISGPLTKEKMNKIIEVYEFLGGSMVEEQTDAESKFAKVNRLIDKMFPASPFTTPQLQEAYEDTYQEPIKLSTLSTYLNRLTDQRVLKRVRTSTGYIYRKITLTTKINH